MIGDIKKHIFWLFGIFLSIFVYVFIEASPIFYSLRQNQWIVFAIMLVILVLFFVIGIFVSKIPLEYILLSKSGNASKTDFNKIVKNSELESRKLKLKIFIKNLNNTLNYVISSKTLEKSIASISKYTGIDQISLNKLLDKKKKLIFIKKMYWVIGLLLSISSYIIIKYSNSLEFINYSFLPFFISFVILFLFFVEGILVTKLPYNYYLEVLDLNTKKIFKYRENIAQKKDIIKSYKNKEEKSIQIIKNTISYLKSFGVNDKDIESLLEKQGFDSKEATKLIKYCKPKNKLDNVQSGSLMKLFVSKMSDEFTSLKNIYSEINKLNQDIESIKKEQEKITKLTSEQLKVNYRSKNNKNHNLDLEDDTKLSKQLNAFKDLPNSKEYKNKIEFLYNLLKPYASKYKKKDFESFLLSQGYEPFIIDDIFLRFEKDNITFSTSKKSIGDQFVFFVNDFYYKMSKNN